MQGEQSSHKGERNTVCVYVPVCRCVCTLEDGGESVVFHSFLP